MRSSSATTFNDVDYSIKMASLIKSGFSKVEDSHNRVGISLLSRESHHVLVVGGKTQRFERQNSFINNQI